MSEEQIGPASTEVIPGDGSAISTLRHLCLDLRRIHAEQATVNGIETYEAVSAANRAYYEAFESRDMDAMSDLWSHGEEVLCTHPGWVTLRGWGEVASSFYALFSNDTAIQFVLTDEKIVQCEDVAWVALDENILGDQSGATVSALNIFVYTNDRWTLVCHHASLVSLPIEEDE